MHEDVCCFIGEECKEGYYHNVKNRIKKEIEKAISEGYRYFVTGLMTGVDIMGAEIVLEQKIKIMI